MELDPKKKRKAEKLTKVIAAGGKESDLEIANQLDELEQKVDDLLPDVKKIISLVKGDKGDIGDTPEVDYPSIVDEVLSRIPTPKDGETPEVDYEGIIKEVVSKVPKPKDGKDAVVDYDKILLDVLSQIEMPKDGDEITVESIAGKLNSQTEIIEPKVIIGLEKSLKERVAEEFQRGGGSGGIFTYVEGVKKGKLNTINFKGSGITYSKVNGLDTIDFTLVGGVDTITNSDSTLTISPTTGNVVASLNLSHSNNWLTDQYFAGKLGIGTTNPLTKFSILSSGTALTVADNFGLAGTFESPQATGQDSTISLVANGAVAINTGGVLGFGASYNGSGYANWASIKGLKTDGVSGNYGGYLAFFTRQSGSVSAERMRITDLGTVGIGVTVPAEKLDVLGNIKVLNSSGAVWVGSGNTNAQSGSSAFGVSNTITGINGVVTGYSNNVSSNGQNNAVFGNSNTLSAGQQNQIFGNYNTISSGDGYNTIAGIYNSITSPAQNSVAIGYANAVSSSLSFGVGTSNTVSGATSAAYGYNNTASASGTLIVGSNITNSVANTLQMGVSNTAKITVDSSGFLGIGTTGPAQRLDVVSSTNNDYDGFIIRPVNLTQSLALGWRGISASLDLNLGNTSASAIIFKVNGTECSRFDTVGKLGVGTGATVNSSFQINGSFSSTYVAKTSNYTATIADYMIDCTSGTFTVTLPTAVGITGRMYVIKNTGTGVITVDGNASETIDGALTYSLSVQYQSITIMSDNANWKII